MTDNIVPTNLSPSPFDAIRRYRADGSEYWLGRELMTLFAYSRWENFGASVTKHPSVIQKAIISTKASETHTEACFRYTTKMSPMPNGGTKEVEDCELTRYAAYMTAMNGDVSKPEVASAQAYFAAKTREAETNQSKQTQPALPSRELALETARSVSEIKGLLSDTDPRLCQMLVDVAINDAMQTIKAIAPSTETKWMGVAEIAESLNLQVTTSNRISLGKFVKSLCGEIAKQESRICNGRMTPIWCYPMPNTDVEDAVRKYFN